MRYDMARAVQRLIIEQEEDLIRHLLDHADRQPEDTDETEADDQEQMEVGTFTRSALFPVAHGQAFTVTLPTGQCYRITIDEAPHWGDGQDAP